MRIAFALCVGIAICCGCAERAEHTGSADVTLSVGDQLDQSLKEIQQLGLVPVEYEEAVDSASEGSRNWLIGNWGDALFLTAADTGKDGVLVLSSLYWYRNWEEDSSLAQSQRQRRIDAIETIDLTKLLQDRGRPRRKAPENTTSENPFGP